MIFEGKGTMLVWNKCLLWTLRWEHTVRDCGRDFAWFQEEIRTNAFLRDSHLWAAHQRDTGRYGSPLAHHTGNRTCLKAFITDCTLRTDVCACDSSTQIFCRGYINRTCFLVRSVNALRCTVSLIVDYNLHVFHVVDFHKRVFVRKRNNEELVWIWSTREQRHLQTELINILRVLPSSISARRTNFISEMFAIGWERRMRDRARNVVMVSTKPLLYDDLFYRNDRNPNGVLYCSQSCTDQNHGTELLFQRIPHTDFETKTAWYTDEQI